MKIFCNTCKRYTNHKLLQEHQQSFYPENTPDMEIDFAHGTWQIVCCVGCETVSFREIWVTSDDLDPETGQPAEVETLYPRRSANAITPKNLFNVPEKLRKLYLDVIDCYNYGQYILCGSGLRALIEGVCSEKGVSISDVTTARGKKRRPSLEDKIERLHQKGILTQEHAHTLHGHRHLGNHALHELDSPAREELQLGIEILEHTLENLYELPGKGEELQIRQSWRKKQ